MDYPVVATRNWRATALVAAAVAALELLVLLVLGIAFLAKPVLTQERAHAQATSRTDVTPAAPTGADDDVAGPVHTRSETSVVVLNGNGIPGAADDAAAQVHARRYVVTGATNASRSDFPRTLVMYRPGWEREAKRLAADVGAKRVAPLDGMRAHELMGANIALILGRR